MGLVYLDHSPKKVALVCMGPSCTDYLAKTLTQEFDPDWADEVWTINMAANAFRTDLVFWLDDLVEQNKFRPKLFAALRRWGMPVITSVRRPEIVPNSFDYPIAEVAAIAVPIFGRPYLNNGVAMAVAYALWKGVKTITIYGADFTYPNRDFAESGRACVEAWMMVAAAHGLSVELCPTTSLMDQAMDKGVYGYKDQPEVILPDGRIFKYVKPEPRQYVPEDSSGLAASQRNGGAVPDAISQTII